MSSSARERYERLFERVSSPKSSDVGRSTIYQFAKFCKCCGTGIKKPAQWDRRAIKALFKKSFCTPECLGKGKAIGSGYGQNPSDSAPFRKQFLIEEMAFAAIEVMREEEYLPPVLKHVLYADANFGYLSEKLAYLEHSTSQKWNQSRFYNLLHKARG